MADTYCKLLTNIDKLIKTEQEYIGTLCSKTESLQTYFRYLYCAHHLFIFICNQNTNQLLSNQCLLSNHTSC